MTFKAAAFDMDGLMLTLKTLTGKRYRFCLDAEGMFTVMNFATPLWGGRRGSVFELFRQTFEFPETWQEL